MVEKPPQTPEFLLGGIYEAIKHIEENLSNIREDMKENRLQLNLLENNKVSRQEFSALESRVDSHEQKVAYGKGWLVGAAALGSILSAVGGYLMSFFGNHHS
jgi:hypothetical protein